MYRKMCIVIEILHTGKVSVLFAFGNLLHFIVSPRICVTQVK
jgi:hypothetical protein